jgi:hypothetical protein
MVAFNRNVCYFFLIKSNQKSRQNKGSSQYRPRTHMFCRSLPATIKTHNDQIKSFSSRLALIKYCTKLISVQVFIKKNLSQKAFIKLEHNSKFLKNVSTNFFED